MVSREALEIINKTPVRERSNGRTVVAGKDRTTLPWAAEDPGRVPCPPKVPIHLVLPLGRAAIHRGGAGGAWEGGYTPILPSCGPHRQDDEEPAIRLAPGMLRSLGWRSLSGLLESAPRTQWWHWTTCLTPKDSIY